MARFEEYELDNSLFREEKITGNGPIPDLIGTMEPPLLICKLCETQVCAEDLDVHDVVINGHMTKVTQCPGCDVIEVYSPWDGASFYRDLEALKIRHALPADVLQARTFPLTCNLPVQGPLTTEQCTEANDLIVGLALDRFPRTADEVHAMMRLVHDDVMAAARVVDYANCAVTGFEDCQAPFCGTHRFKSQA